MLNKDKCLLNFEIDTNRVDFKFLSENACPNNLININNKNVLINWFIYLLHVYYTKLNSRDLDYIEIDNFLRYMYHICTDLEHDIYEKIKKIGTINYVIFPGNERCYVYMNN